MKRLSLLLLVLTFTFSLAACSSGSSKSDITLAGIIKAYTDQGIKVDPSKKPMFQMIGAEDGVIFDIDKSKVAIYQYKTSSDTKKAKSTYEAAKDWPAKDRFLLEAYSEKAKQIFENIK